MVEGPLCCLTADENFSNFNLTDGNCSSEEICQAINNTKIEHQSSVSSFIHNHQSGDTSKEHGTRVILPTHSPNPDKLVGKASVKRTSTRFSRFLLPWLEGRKVGTPGNPFVGKKRWEKFNLKSKDTACCSSVCDDPPYENSDSDTLDDNSFDSAVVAEDTHKKALLDTRQSKSVDCFIGNWLATQNNSSKIDSFAIDPDGETECDVVESGRLGFCGLCSWHRKGRRQKNLKRRQLKAPQVEQIVEHCGVQKAGDLESTSARISTPGTPSFSDIRVSPPPKFDSTVEFRLMEAVTKEKTKSYSSIEEAEQQHLSTSYSSGAESEQLCRRLQCLIPQEDAWSKTSYAEDNDSDWAVMKYETDVGQTIVAGSSKTNASLSPLPPEGYQVLHTSCPQSPVEVKQSNCSNVHLAEVITGFETCFVENNALLCNTFDQRITNYNKTESTISTPSSATERYKDGPLNSARSGFHYGLHFSLPELNLCKNGRKSTLTMVRHNYGIKGSCSIFDSMPHLRQPHRLYHTPRPVSQTTYVIAKIDLPDSVGQRTYSIISNSHSECSLGGVVETTKSDTTNVKCQLQSNNNAAVEPCSSQDHALPGMVQKEPTLLSLIKEARAVGMVPESLPEPSYSWTKKEASDDDCMILPNRRLKQTEMKEKASRNNGEKVESGLAPPTLQPNPPSVAKGHDTSLQSVIETMQKLKSAEMQIKALKEAQNTRKNTISTNQEVAATVPIGKAPEATVVDYKERKRLRRQKELEEARKELLEATKSALKDRIAFHMREEGHTPPDVHGSTLANVEPKEHLTDAEKFSSKPQPDVSHPQQPFVEEPKEQAPLGSGSANSGNDACKIKSNEELMKVKELREEPPKTVMFKVEKTVLVRPAAVLPIQRHSLIRRIPQRAVVAEAETMRVKIPPRVHQQKSRVPRRLVLPLHPIRLHVLIHRVHHRKTTRKIGTPTFSFLPTLSMCKPTGFRLVGSLSE
ncbi:unnamed protein product [Mesocestoides corti]|uniref:Uncharacterized protein n=1 Tax=Mesocestoides corti TaxID=53468 RepID=A0A0R3ULC0_MESCO|nr:unnamed protein product [Mesocestoides corti]